jgi:hypothetical protein
MATTLLEDLLLENSNENKMIQVSSDNMCAILLDFSNDEQVRFEALELFYSLRGYEVVEILKKLVSVFCMSQTKLFQQFLIRICKSSSLPYALRLETCKDICIYKDDSDDLFFVLVDLMKEIPFYQGKDKITYVKEMEAIVTLMRNDNFKAQSKQCMRQFLQKTKELDSEYRYKSILSLQTHFDQRKRWLTKEDREILDKTLYEYQLDFFTFFATDKNNEASFRILSAQFILSNIEKFTFHNEKNTSRREDVIQNLCESLFEIGEDDANLYNTRADAIDVVLRYSVSQECKNTAKKRMMKLAKEGQNNKELFTIYNNAQNAHSEEIENSALQTFQKLASYPFLRNYTVKLFETICEKIKPHLNENGTIALSRITLDNAVYGSLKLTLKSAFVLVYKYIEQLSDADETKQLLFSRLYEELSESAGICSTGILERMANTFTGIIDDLGIRISVDDQIMAVFATKITHAIKNLVNEACVHTRFCFCRDYICDSGKFFLSLFCESVREGILSSGVREDSNASVIQEGIDESVQEGINASVQENIQAIDLSVQKMKEKELEYEKNQCGECSVCQNKEELFEKIKKYEVKQIDKKSEHLFCCHKCQEDGKCNIPYMERLLEEMMIPVQFHNKRKTFLSFFRKYFPFIYDDMYTDFVISSRDLDHTSFDLYIRKAVLHYVGEE